jgi:hypothetical protein
VVLGFELRTYMIAKQALLLLESLLQPKQILRPMRILHHLSSCYALQFRISCDIQAMQRPQQSVDNDNDWELMAKYS